MRKRLTENVIDANNCERNDNERKYVVWKKKQKTNRRRETATTQKRHPN